MPARHQTSFPDQGFTTRTQHPPKSISWAGYITTLNAQALAVAAIIASSTGGFPTTSLAARNVPKSAAPVSGRAFLQAGMQSLVDIANQQVRHGGLPYIASKCLQWRPSKTMVRR